MKTHCLGPYVIIQIIEKGTIQLEEINGAPFKGLVNGSRINPYQDNHSLVDLKKNKNKNKWKARQKKTTKICIFMNVYVLCHRKCVSREKRKVFAD